MDQKTTAYLQARADEIRRLTIESIGKLSAGHIGGSADLCELLAVLYHHVMRIDPERPDWRERDRFVLSKGHGGPAVYAALATRGYFPVSELDTLNRPGTRLPSHCDMLRTRGVDMTTGSLGQGFSCAVGMAIGAKLDRLPSYVYVCIGDGESQEGQVWEAAMLAGSRGLDNLIAFTDYNKMQIDGYIEQVNGLEPLDEKWRAFRWHVQAVDGHDVAAIAHAVDNARKIKERPSMILLHTVKGKGCDFAENRLGSHNMKGITEEMWRGALAALGTGQV